jgi:hypothetical protein
MADVSRRGDPIFKLLGVPNIVVGLIFFLLSGWMAWKAWRSVARWPQTNAVLVSKHISRAGARLMFRYPVYGRTLTGVGFRWGSEASVEHALESYIPGTVHRIAYNPLHPSEVEPSLQFDYLVQGPIAASLFAALFIIGGWAVFRWSKPHGETSRDGQESHQES